MIISPQLGHGNFVASVVGAMILWHDVHVGMVVVVCSVTVVSSWNVRYNAWLFICAVFLCVRVFVTLFAYVSLLLVPLLPPMLAGIVRMSNHACDVVK